MNNIVLNKLAYVLILIAGIVIVYMGMIKLTIIFLPFVFGWLISKLITPVVVFLHEKMKLPNSLSSVIMILTVVGISSYLVYLLGKLIVSIFREFSRVLPFWSSVIAEYGTKWSEKISDLFIGLPFDPATVISEGAASILSNMGNLASELATKSFSIASSLPSLLIALVIIILSAFFFTKDRAMITAVLKPYRVKYITNNRYWISFKGDILVVVWGYVKAQLILMSLTFVISAIGLSVIGIPNAIFVALGIGIVDALPMFGPAAIYMPWILTMVIGSQSALAIKLLVMYGITTLTRQFLEPKIVGTQIGIHPLLTLTGLYAGVKFLGIPGLIIGPFTMVAAVTLYSKYHHSEEHDLFFK